MHAIKESTLAEICTLVTDGTHDTPKRVENGFPLIKAKEIVGGVIDFESCDHISGEEHLRVISRSKPEFGDTLFAHIGASLGEAALVKTKRVFSIKNIALFKPNHNVVDGRYLYYVVRSPLFQGMAKNAKTGSAQPFLSLGDLRSHKVRFHECIQTQRKIASILSAYDDLIENNTRRIAILEEMAQAIYREWFVHFRFPGHENVKLVDSPLGQIPEGWEAMPLENVLEFYIGGGWGKEAEEEGFTEIGAVIRGTDIPNAKHMNVSNCPTRFHKQSNIRSRRLRDGDIVFEVSGGSKGQPVGRSVFVSDRLLACFEADVICASFCKLIRPDREKLCSSLFFHYLLDSYTNGIIEQYEVQSTGIKNFKFTEFVAREHITVPPPAIQLLFDERFQSIQSQIEVLGKKATNLRATRDLLLPKLISGKLDVEDLDIDTGELTEELEEATA